MSTYNIVIYISKIVKETFHEQNLMTEKLYWKDAYQTHFKADIVEVNNQGIILDKTLFYPEGGNQASDKGIIKKGNQEFEVKHVSNENDLILHQLSNNFQENLKRGDLIEGIIDWEYRYGIMRAHSSQHVLSAIFKNLLNIDTIRANISFEDISLNISKSITIDELEKVLCLFLKICTIENLQFQSKIITQNEVKMLKKQIRGNLPNEVNLRIVEIRNYDFNFCGGTHIKNSSEIGPFFFYEIKKGKEFKYFVGNKAINMISKQNLGIIDLASLLNVPFDNVSPFVKKMILDLKESNLNLINKMLEAVADNPIVTPKGNKIGILNIDLDYKIIIKKFKEFHPNYILIIKRNPKSLIILSNNEEYKANDIVDLLIKKYGGKGGGSPISAQVTLEYQPQNLISDIDNK